MERWQDYDQNVRPTAGPSSSSSDAQLHQLGPGHDHPTPTPNERTIPRSPSTSSDHPPTSMADAARDAPGADADDQDQVEDHVCRVCRSGAPEDGALFWPCQCAGSIKYVHESCMNEWVRVSKKSKCELCRTPLHYTSIYPAHMPSHLPPKIVLRHLVSSLLSSLALVLRLILVALLWLVVLPYAIESIFKLFICTADGLGIFSLVITTRVTPVRLAGGTYMTLLPRTTHSNSGQTIEYFVNSTLCYLKQNLTSPASSTTLMNMTTGLSSLIQTPLDESSDLVHTATQSTPNWIGRLDKIDYIRTMIYGPTPRSKIAWDVIFDTIASDVFKGQVITSIVIVLFVIGFLVREWILTNAPPEIPPAPAPAAAAEAPVIPELIVGEERAQRLVHMEIDDELRGPQYDEMWRHLERTLDRLAAVDPSVNLPPRQTEQVRGVTSDARLVHDEEEEEEDQDYVDSEREDRSGESESSDEDDEDDSDEEYNGVHIPGLTGDYVPGLDDPNGGPSYIIRRVNPEGSQPPPVQPAQEEARPSPPILRGELAPAPRAPAANIAAREVPPPPEQQINNERAMIVAADAANAPILPDDPPPNDDDFAAEDLFDDFEGVLEAIGMRGSFSTLLQNFCLMMLLVSLCLAIGLWIPLSLGKVMAGLDAIRWVVMPLRVVRWFSDPVFDKAFEVVMWAPRKGVRFVDTMVQDAGDGTILGKVLAKFGGVASHSPVVANSTVAVASTKPLAASSVKTTFKTAVKHYKMMGHAEDTFHRALCTALGYMTFLLGGAGYLHITDNEYSRSVNRAIREGISQQLTLLKVCFFVAVEIILFPASCGLLVNLSTYPLFPGASLATRLNYLHAAPFSGFFLTWLAGTIFMFSFSAAIDAVREVVRPGLIWFIKDPQSHDFHPIREILERSSWTQAKKIFTSMLLYGSVIFLSLSTNVFFLKYCCPTILPLDWLSTRSFSVPLDLLIYRFVVPFTIGLVEPRSIAKTWWTQWARQSAKALRLSHFLFGERNLDEEGTHVRRTWRARILLLKAPVPPRPVEGDDRIRDTTFDDELFSSSSSTRPVIFQHDGGFGRVPALDTVRTAPNRPMLIRVTSQGFPLTPRGEQVIAEQVSEMATTRKKDAYEVVYLPPAFAVRVGVWCYLAWLAGSAALVGGVVGPLVVGRYLLSKIASSPPHDFYAFTLGAHLLILFAYGISHASQFRPSRQTWSTIRIFSMTILLAGILTPLALGLFVEVYVVQPVKLLQTHRYIAKLLPTPSAPSASISTIHVLPSWSLGILIQHLLLLLLRSPLILPSTSPLRLAQSRAKTLWLHQARPAALSLLLKDLYTPLFLTLLTSLLFPTCLAISLHRLLLHFYPSLSYIPSTHFEPYPITTCIQLTYFIHSTLFILITFGWGFRKWWLNWLGRRRELEYLVERRLRNYESLS
ncbi:hypothetical protein MVLG_05837 [Microbotryum lychnidis-dioicae p1A1 Lamole]|uniref:RING-type E3 ubiquitin transferase n=1 Tax=Microbotryum lychnidis-dioicae (strain p1A1 Lamole / MvSl-1064) TaxID=683840 RepID=U5HFG0_USTV1|nr:hypothetical protein MVLG_05837 [Microbotryum lychnidis-dioicae p1A1 Lamole]|eukprot:KDE03706.1 hypothetical protein MVLG_05837 [Microbotryum lychnidis-dioicae p1A1 Lamole]